MYISAGVCVWSKAFRGSGQWKVMHSCVNIKKLPNVKDDGERPGSILLQTLHAWMHLVIYTPTHLFIHPFIELQRQKHSGMACGLQKQVDNIIAIFIIILLSSAAVVVCKATLGSSVVRISISSHGI